MFWLLYFPVVLIIAIRLASDAALPAKV